jgi:hypothetical protein
MNDLPSPLLVDIISLLDPSEQPLSSYCTVSKQVQFAVERRTFRYIRLKSTDLKRFEEIFWDYNRREALAQIDYNVILPSYSDKRCASYERAKDKDLNNEAFTEAVHALFRILHSWEQETGAKRSNWLRGCPIKLKLAVYSPTDRPYRSEDNKQAREKLEDGRDLFEKRYENSFLRLLQDELPIVLRITGFEFPRTLETPRHVEGAALAAIAAKLPNLELIKWQIEDKDKKSPLLQQQRRYGT